MTDVCPAATPAPAAKDVLFWCCGSCSCVYTSTGICWLSTGSSVLVHVVHYSRSCPVITTNTLQWNLSNAAPPFFMLLFLFRCRCVQVLSQSPANRDCKGGAGPGGGAEAQTTSRPVGQQHARHISVSTQSKGLDAVVAAAGFHTLCDLMLERSVSDVNSSLWKHVSLLSARSFSERTQPQ